MWESLCEAKRGGQPLDYQMVWRFPSTTIHVSLLDFSGISVFSRDPQAGIDRLISTAPARALVCRFRSCGS